MPAHLIRPGNRQLVPVLPLMLGAALAALGPARSGLSLELDCTGIAPAADDALAAEVVLDNLVKPVGVVAPPGDLDRLFLLEAAGSIRILVLATDTLRPTPFLDIEDRVDDGGEKGLLGLAFHPRYADNGRFFVNYTRASGSPGLESVVAEYTASSTDPNVASRAEIVILTYEQPFSNHNAGQLLFGPLDGYLYIPTGDGGDGGDPGNRAQNPLLRLGKILRIDVDVDLEGGPGFGIPQTNPFLGDPNVLPEIWALGLRNPWRNAFDPETGDLYIADVGQGEWEEISLQPAASEGGENYEWRVREGNHDFNTTKPFGPGRRVGAVHEYPHTGGAYNGCSITGGVVYRGCRMPVLHGAYFYADYCRDFIRTLRVEGGAVVDDRDRTAELNAALGGNKIDDISSFGVDGRGEVYICDLANSRKGDTSARLLRIVPKNPPAGGPTFIRGSVNGDAILDISDAVYILAVLFLGVQSPVTCRDALDANDDATVGISDAIFALNYLFAAGAVIPAPFPDCGEDPTPDELGCETSPCS